jgi:hypothetical protein
MRSIRSTGEKQNISRVPSILSFLVRCIFLSLWLLSAMACAQQPSVSADTAPISPQAAQASGQSSGSISGTVIDIGGTVVSGAHVALVAAGAVTARETIADSDGRFSFTGVTAGDFRLTVSCDGLETRSVSGTLHGGDAYEVPKIVLRVATAHTSIDVTLSRHDLAEPEVKAEEKQRLIGAIPNYYVSYTWNAPPMDNRQKFDLAWKSTIDPASFVIVAGFAGLEQSQNDFPGYGQGAAGYGKRFGAGVGNLVVSNMLGGAVLPAVFHQDPRYFYKGTGGFWPRMGYALSTAVITRGDNGRWQPNYSGILGNLGAGAISNLYYPASSRQGASLTIGNGLLGVAAGGVNNVLQEFVLRKLTKNAPSK